MAGLGSIDSTAQSMAGTPMAGLGSIDSTAQSIAGTPVAGLGSIDSTAQSMAGTPMAGLGSIDSARHSTVVTPMAGLGSFDSAGHSAVVTPMAGLGSFDSAGHSTVVTPMAGLGSFDSAGHSTVGTPMAGPSSVFSSPSSSNSLECSICREEFITPKRLPCGHITCRHCIQTWIKTAESAGCPMCRYPLTRPQGAQQGEGGGDPADEVDDWPTDLQMMDRVGFHKILKGPHTCHMCPQRKAQSFCFRCEVKLCADCVDYHCRLPGTASHALQDVTKLTPRQLTDHLQTECAHHEGRMAELYCPDHDELICVTCLKEDHCHCSKTQPIARAAKENRANLKEAVKKLNTAVAQVIQKHQAGETHFEDMRKRADRYFHDLEKAVKNRCLEVNQMIDEAEQGASASMNNLHRQRLIMTSHMRVAEYVVTSSADDTVLQMQAGMTSCLRDLERRGALAGLGPLEELRFRRSAKGVVRHIGKLVMPEEETAGPSTSKRNATPGGSPFVRKRLRIESRRLSDTPSLSD